MKSFGFALLFSSCLFASLNCGGSDAETPGATRDAGARPDASDGGTTDAAPGDAETLLVPEACPASSPEVNVDALRQESVRRLRAFLGATSGYDDGKFYLHERVTAADFAVGPAADQTILFYVSPTDPPANQIPTTILPAGSKFRPVVAWGLNGIGEILFVDVADASKLGAFRLFPSEVVIGLDAATTPARAGEILADLQSKFSADGATWQLLENIGVLVYAYNVDAAVATTDARAGARFAQTLSLVDYGKSIPEITAMEMSNVNYRLPIVDWPARVVLTTERTFKPECLRGESAYHRDYPGAFVGLTSFPPPFSKSFTANPNAKDHEAECFTNLGMVDKKCWSDFRRTRR